MAAFCPLAAISLHYVGVGDIIAHEQGGYLHDGIISAMGVNLLRGRGMDLEAQGKPWFLAVNLVKQRT